MKTLLVFASLVALTGCASTTQQNAEAPVQPSVAPVAVVVSAPPPVVPPAVVPPVVSVAPAATVPVVVEAPLVSPVQAASVTPPVARAAAAEPKTTTGWEDLSRIIAAWAEPAQKAAASNCPQDTRKP